MKRILSLILVLTCFFSLTACGKDAEPTEPYVPPVQGGYFQETEPVIEETEPVQETTAPAVEETEPITEPESPVEETEPVVEETEPPVIELGFIEEMRQLHEGNEIYFKYNTLNDAQKEVYLLACEAIDSGTKTFFLGDIKMTTDDVQPVLRAVWYDHPEYFWMKTGGHAMNSMGQHVVSVEMAYYPELMDKFETNKIAFQRIVDALIERATEKTSILDQERLIHDYLCKSAIYEETALDQSAWSCLVDRKTVCAGYTRAFQILMNELGVPCYMVIGDMVTEEKTERHAWNIVKLVDSFYAVDITSNDCDEKNCVLYNKYNFMYSTFPGQYVIDEECLDYPECNDTRYSFKNIYGIDENVASAMSFADSEVVIYSLAEYKVYHEKICRNKGFGEWEVKYVIVGESTLQDVMNYLQEQAYMDTYIMDIAKFNNMTTFTLQEGLSRVEFDNAYGITHTVNLSGS